jgi:hypothetical protein
MIILRGGTNSVSFTLNEKFDFYTPSVSTYTDLYYVVRITDNMSGYSQNFILHSLNDLSLNKDRSNKFLIGLVEYQPSWTGPNVIDPWGASQSYPIIGMTGSNYGNFDSQWDYDVFGMEGPAPTSGPINLYPSGATALGPAFLEGGRMLYTNIYGKPKHLPH